MWWTIKEEQPILSKISLTCEVNSQKAYPSNQGVGNSHTLHLSLFFGAYAFRTHKHVCHKLVYYSLLFKITYFLNFYNNYSVMCFHYGNNKCLLATPYMVKLPTWFFLKSSCFKNNSSRTYLAFVTKHCYLILFIIVIFGIGSFMTHKC